MNFKIKRQNYSNLDLFRKLIYSIRREFRCSFLRSLKAWFYFKNARITLGTNIKISGLPIQICIGKDVVFYDNSIFEFGANSKFSIGDHTTLSYGVVLCCNTQIVIGDNVQIGEYTSIRDTTHNYKEYGKPMKLNADISSPIIIGNNVWIGRGCIILPGTVIEDGVVVGANSVVKGILVKDGIYAGSPCRLIKMRI